MMTPSNSEKVLPISANTIILGLTGSFGSGCTTFREVLKDKYAFRDFSLSDIVRSEAQNKRIDKTNRMNLQTLGNDLRDAHGRNYLAKKALEIATSNNTTDRLVFDGIKNFGEVQEFRKYPEFYLVAVDCSKPIRLKRLQKKNPVYKNLIQFEVEDERDRDEGSDNGQQVQKCVDEADIILSNESEYEDKKISENLENILNRYIKLLTEKENDVTPTTEELNMSLASNMALKSSCLKRKVGAVICNKEGRVVATGYNEVLKGQQTCLQKYGECYRDKKRNEIMSKMEEKMKVFDSNWHKAFGTVKVLELCRSLHAEEIAILQTSESLTGEGTLYSTTFPCYLCAKMIVRSGIKKVVYIEPYPMDEAMDLLIESEVRLEKFEGVKARVFYKLFKK
jgi:deoxycytidylate deaminase